ncbi:hypothetical protein EV1_023220 [Malus domestica]
MRLDMLFIRCFQERITKTFLVAPSTPFEYYSLDYRVLRRFAKHNSTGEIIPKELVMQGARKMFAATDLQRQNFYAAVGQTFFGEQPTPPTSSFVADLKREYTSWKHVEGTHLHTRYNHLVNYGAGYYSYLYAKVVCGVVSDRQPRPLSCHLRAEGANLLSTQVARARRTKLPSSLTEF